MRFLLTFAIIVLAFPALAADRPTLTDLSFLEGDWISDRSGFVIEEHWTDASAGVIVTSSRGVQNGGVRFVRFAVAQETADGVVMRFNRHNADFSTWETEGPTVMRLTEAGAGVAIFEAADPRSDVQRIIYKSGAEGAINVVANRVDQDGPYLVEFTLTKKRLSD